MGKYIKLFDTHTNYNTYITGNNKVLPNVSYCEDMNEVHFNPWVETKLVCKYNITDTSSATTLRTELEQNMFKSMEIDGVLLDSLVTEYQFSTTGEHTVKYELYDETKVGNNAPLFNNITTLTSVSIPNSVTIIGNFAFINCSLTSINIPDSVTSIGNNAFTHCGLTSVTIPNNVITIGNRVFDGCSGLTSVTIGNSVTNIGSNAFDGCSLVNIEFNSPTFTNAFFVGTGNNTKVTIRSVILGNNVSTIDSHAFDGCTGLTSITIPNSVTTIGGSAFKGCTAFTNITLPNGITSIGNNVFQNCTGLTSVTIPDSVTFIDGGVFYSCTGLTSVIIGNSVTQIGIQLFNGCSNLASVTIRATNPPALTWDNDMFLNSTNCPIYVPSESVAAYKAASYWAVYASRIQAIP